MGILGVLGVAGVVRDTGVWAVWVGVGLGAERCRFRPFGFKRV